MGFRDHFRSSKRSDDRTSSISSSSTAGKTTTGSTTPTDNTTTPSPLQTVKTHTDKTSQKDKDAPSITLTKSHSRLGKTLTWHTSSSSNKKEATKDKQLKAWAKEDAVEWTSPMSQRPGRKDMGCQNTLRAFDFRKAALGEKDRSFSVGSGVSPSCSRVGSVDDGVSLAQQKRLSAVGPGKLSQEIAR